MYFYVFIISLRMYQVSKRVTRMRSLYFPCENKCYSNVLLYIYETGIAFFSCFKTLNEWLENTHLQLYFM